MATPGRRTRFEQTQEYARCENVKQKKRRKEKTASSWLKERVVKGKEGTCRKQKKELLIIVFIDRFLNTYVSRSSRPVLRSRL